MKSPNTGRSIAYYRQAAEVSDMVRRMGTKPTVSSSDKKASTPTLESKGSHFLFIIAGVPMSELKRLIAHGVVLPSAFMEIAESYPETDLKQLKSNMTAVPPELKLVQHHTFCFTSIHRQRTLQST